MKRLIGTIFLLLMVGMLACSGNKEEEMPTMSRSETIDLMLKHARLQNLVNRYIVMQGLDSVEMVYAHFENQLFDSVGITKEVYEANVRYYQQDEMDFIKMYDEMIDSLMLKDTRAKEPQKASEVKKESTPKKD